LLTRRRIDDSYTDTIHTTWCARETVCSLLKREETKVCQARRRQGNVRALPTRTGWRSALAGVGLIVINDTSEI